MSSNNDLGPLSRYSTISLGHRKPSCNLGLWPRSMQPSNISLVRMLHPMKCECCSNEVITKRSESRHDTCPISETPHVEEYAEIMFNDRDDVEVRSQTHCNLSKNGVYPKVKKKLPKHKFNYHRQRLKSYASKHRQDMRTSLSRLNNINVMLMRHLDVMKNDLNFDDVSTQDSMTPSNKNKKPKNQRSVVFTEDINTYEEHLYIKVISWLLDIPIFYSLDFSPKTLKNNFADPLTNKLEELLKDVFDPSYETKVKKEITNCLEVLPMWLPYTKTERVRFKNELCEKLYKKLKKLNNKFIKMPTKDKDDDETSSKSDTISETEFYYEHRQKDIISNEIYNWLSYIPFDKPTFKVHTVEFMVNRLRPLLSINNYKNSYKLLLKEEIIDILNNLPIKKSRGKNKLLYRNEIAEELACRLLRLKLQLLYSKQKTDKVINKHSASEVKGLPIHADLVKAIRTKINNTLENSNVQNKKDVKREICNVVLNSIETLRKGLELNTNIQIYDILRQIGNADESTAMKIAKNIKIYIKIALIQDKGTSDSTKCMQFKPPDPITVFRSSIDTLVTSTPKQPTKKHVPRLNPGETSYMKNVATLIRSSMNTLPNNLDEYDEYKNIVISDLAGDIMDEFKRVQLSPEMNIQVAKNLQYYVLRWITKFDLFDDLREAKPWVETFLDNLKKIPVPDLTASQYGTRQAMRNLQLAETEFGWKEDYVPRGLDVLEDQISVWIHDQPTELYKKRVMKNHEKLVKVLALKLQDDLRNNTLESQIESDINAWLKHIIKDTEKENLGLLTQDLKQKIINVPQDETLEARNIKRQKDMEEYRQRASTSTKTPAEEAATTIEDSPAEKTMRDFIAKYIEHNYDVDDPMIRGALSELLILELRRVLPPIREEVYENFAKRKRHEKFKPEQLNEVLEYIKIISDWLKNLPIHPLYNTPGHRPRIDFVNDLARNIQEVENKRKENPNAMDYDLFIFSVIGESMRTYNIPVLPEHKQDINAMIKQLLSQIIANRSVINESNQSNISDIKEQTLSEFIEDYIRLNGREIADDEVKLDAWTARLLEEVKKMVNEGADPRTMNKAELYERFAQVQDLEDEPVQRFNSEMLYVKEISDWLKNLPLLSETDNSSEVQREKILMVTALAQKLANTNLNNKIGNKQLEDYISAWILKLPLDPHKDVEVPLLVQQLLKRINKIDKAGETLPDELFDGKEIFHTRSEPKHIDFTKDPGTHMVQFIENWCDKLPIGEGDDVKKKEMTNNIANNLYKRISQLNADPKIFNDDLLYKDLLEDEIDTQLENVPQSTQLQKNREQLKIKLIDTILDMKNAIKKKSVGDTYRRKLETSIDSSIPNPVNSRQFSEPGFEIYKNHLASMFILDNFDHSDDEVKAKYATRVRGEVDKYFSNAIKKNALPISRDQLYNELYSELYKVPMPDKESMGDTVEKIKTRYDIDVWFDELPVQRTDNLTDQLELDQILSTMAERIHHIEKHEPEPDEKIRNEIHKWLSKIPLQPGQEQNKDNFVGKLQDSLKKSANARKYVPYEPKKMVKGKRDEKRARNKYLDTRGANSKPYTGRPLYDTKQKKSGDLILEIVEQWCNELPLIGDELDVNILKDDLSTKIVLKVYELNNDSEIFNDDTLYDQLLDEELDNLMVGLPVNDEFEASKPARKYQLKEWIKSVKPLINEEKQRYQYKTDLKNITSNILKDHADANDKVKQFDKLTNDIVNNFIECNYKRDDDEGKQIYKNKLHDAVVDYFTNNNISDKVDPLVIKNQLWCELSKVPVPNDAILKDIVEETEMRNEVENFFVSASLDDDSEATAQMKDTLAKRLTDIEKLRPSDYSDKKMSSEITKCLNKINKTAPPQVIEDFVNTLRSNENYRKPNIAPRTDHSDVNDEYGSKSYFPGYQQRPSTANKHLSQSWAPERTRQPNHGNKYYDSPAIRQNRTAPDEIIWCEHPSHRNQSGNEKEPRAAPSPQYSVAPRGVPPREYTTPLSSTAPIYSEPSQFPFRLNRAIPQRSLQEPSSKYQGSLSKYRGAPVSESPFETESQRYRSQQQKSSGSTNNRNQHLNYRPQRNYEPSNYPNEVSQYQDRSLNYDNFNGRNMLTSTPIKQDESLNYDYFKDRSKLTSTPLNHGNRRPLSNTSRHLDSSNIRNPNYEQASTPRRVQGEAQAFQTSSLRDTTPRSLFEAPNFNPAPLFSPPTVPQRDANLCDHPRRYQMAPQPISKDEAMPEDAGPMDHEGQVCECQCGNRTKAFYNRRSCPRLQSYNPYSGYIPVWCRVQFPDYYY